MLIVEQIDKLFINFLQKNKIQEYVFNILMDDDGKVKEYKDYYEYSCFDYKNIFYNLASMERRYKGNNFLISFQEKWHDECVTLLTKYHVTRLKENIKAYRLFRYDFYRINSQKYFFTIFLNTITLEHIKEILGFKIYN